jgi:hypothetical protein
MVLNHIFNYDITHLSGSFFYQCTPLALCVTIHADLGRICIADTITTFFPKKNLSNHLSPPPPPNHLSPLPHPALSLPTPPLPPSFCCILKRNLFQRLSLQSFKICLQNYGVFPVAYLLHSTKGCMDREGGRATPPPPPPHPSRNEVDSLCTSGGGGGVEAGTKYNY